MGANNASSEAGWIQHVIRIGNLTRRLACHIPTGRRSQTLRANHLTTKPGRVWFTLITIDTPAAAFKVTFDLVLSRAFASCFELCSFASRG
jgi:hypothetical protein